MLHLHRKLYQDIVIELPDGQLMEIVVSKIGNKQVCLSFKNDDKIKVYRGELYDRIKEEK